MERPLVTVVIPTYNSAEFLPATLESVFCQTYDHLEIVVVDDGSSDQTQMVIGPYLDRLKYVKQENWGGPSRPRNVAIGEASGDLVAFFDSDDLMMPNKIACAVQAFSDHPELGLVFSNFQGIDESGNILVGNFLEAYQDFRNELTGDSGGSVRCLNAKAAYSSLLRANFVGTSSVVCPRAVLKQVGSFDEKMMNADDVDMWRRIAFAGYGFGFIDQVLHGYRKRGGGVTARGVRRYPAVLYGLGKQLELDLEPGDRKYLEGRIHGLELEYASALTNSGQHGEARQLFRRALENKVSWRALKGLMKAYLRM